MKDPKEFENKAITPKKKEEAKKDPSRHPEPVKGITKEESAAMPKGNPGFGSE